jgi:DNA-binding response OmpR family regulator
MDAVRGARVLIVDANAHIRRLIATLLGAIGITDLPEARTPMAAVPLMLQQPPDLVIVDWTTDPTEVLLFIHRLRRGELADSRTPVLALAGSTHHAVLERAWQAGIDDVIAKPMSAIELIQRASALLTVARRAETPAAPEAAAAE